MFSHLWCVDPITIGGIDRDISEQVAHDARTQGWQGALAWDCIDDPHDTGTGNDHAAPSTKTLLEDIHELANQGLTLPEVHERIAYRGDQRSLERLITRHNQHELLAQLRKNATQREYEHAL